MIGIGAVLVAIGAWLASIPIVSWIVIILAGFMALMAAVGLFMDARHAYTSATRSDSSCSHGHRNMPRPFGVLVLWARPSFPTARGDTMNEDRIEGEAKQVEGEAQETWGKAKDQADDLLDEGKDKAGDAWDKAKDTLDNLGDKIDDLKDRNDLDEAKREREPERA